MNYVSALIIELHVKSETDLALLAAEIESTNPVCQHYFNGYWLKIECEEACEKDGPDEQVHGLCRTIEALSPAGLKLWQSAVLREVHMERYVNWLPPVSSFNLRTDTLARVAHLGATLTVDVLHGAVAARAIGIGRHRLRDTIRKAFVMTVHPGQEAEYMRRHQPIWPELEAALRAHGVATYSIFFQAETRQLFAYVEFIDEEAWKAVARTTVCQRWWAHMRELMPTNADNSPVSQELPEVFHLGRA